MKEKDYFTIKDMLRAGCICRRYGATDFFTCNPQPEIDKVRMSIIKLHSDGKDSANFYLSTEEMRQLCHEIDTGAAYKKISEDKASFPSAYKFVTGKDGSKHLNIGSGMKGIRIQIQMLVNGKQVSKMLPIGDYTVLQGISFWYKAVMGLIPVSRYYGDLVDTFWEGIKEREKYSKSSVSADDQEYIPEQTEKAPEVAKSTTDVKSKEPQQVNGSSKNSAANSPAPVPKDRTFSKERYIAENIAALKSTPGFAVQAKSINGEKTVVYFLDAKIDPSDQRISVFRRTLESGKKNVPFVFSGCEIGGKIYCRSLS